MVVERIRNNKKYLFLAVVAFWCIVATAAPGIQFVQPRLEGFHPLDEGPAAITPLNAEHPSILELKSNLFYDKENIDFEKRQITFSRVDSLGFTMWEYHFSEMSEYLSSRRNFVVAKSWYRDVASARRAADAKKQDHSLKMQWELPVQYPSWAQRILGNEPPRLTIDGNLTITMGFDHSTYQEGNESKESQSRSNDFGFDIQYQFGIQGTVGKLINVGIRVADQEVVSDNNFKNFKIEYKESTPGEMEDEIIQEVIAGWTNFDMPGTELSGYAGGKDGLFGIKIKSKLGPLTLTTIASQEKGEAQKLNLSLKNGGSEKLIAASEYRKNVFFFLDTLYRNYYNKNFGKAKNASSGYEAPPHVDTLDVYLLQENYQNDAVQPLLVNAKDEAGQSYKFIKLIPDKHYEVFRDEGYIRFDTAINSNSMIAIYLRTSNGQLKKGANGDTLSLWTLKPLDPILEAKKDPERFYCMWRNVYDLDTSQLATFELTLKRHAVGENDTSIYATTRSGEKKLLTEILGLSGKDGKPLTEYEQIYDKQHEYILIPPYGECPTCNEPFNNPDLGEDYRDSVIYRISSDNNDWNLHKSIYTFKTTGTQKVTSINLGWQVMSGSELVRTSSGDKLEKDVDYIIDYESGMVELISPRALAADNVDVTFQQEAMFVPESKVFLGVRGEMALPFLSEKSFVGASLLFQNAGTNEIPRLEQEPYSKLLIDLNLKAEFEPEWMTWLINKLPLIKTEQASSVVLEVEAANSRTNPNTNDEAFVDDFEDSRKTYPLGSSHDSWSKASPPQYILQSRQGGDSLLYDTIHIADSLLRYPQAWDWFWFSPRASDDNYKKKVWKRTTSEQKAGENNYDPILRLHCAPAPRVDSLKNRFYKSWAGIMTPISQSSTDRSRDKYFEFCLNKSDSRGKKLVIQMGVLNEDVSWNGRPPNRRGDYEDTTLAGTGTKDLDKGLDRLWDKDEKYYIPNGTQTDWDSLLYGDDRLGERFKLDPGKDNARAGEKDGNEYENDKELRWKACRLQGDSRYSREDINYDGTTQTSLKEKYFEFVFDLDSMKQYVDPTATVESGWAKYKIPIHDALSVKHAVNDPSWTNIKMVRIVWTDFDTNYIGTESSLWFSDIQFTGNYWLAQTDTLSSTRAEATSLNNHEDDFYKENSKNGLIHHEIIPGTKNDYELESALKILFTDVKPHDTALVRKVIPFQAMDVSQYERMSLVYFGDKEFENQLIEGELMSGGDVEFVFRFGNNDSTYYEYHNQIKGGWNLADIDLQDLAKLKDEYQVRNPGMKIDASAGNYRVYSNRIGVEPSLTKITWMALGIRNNSSKKVTGTIWVNEMKVRGIRKLNGW
ncbi:MAG TPA: cell surface protein SprA, partial [Chitinispirillaceae bacterium]|nr:cell surface protein SprA [Chitinispirillaceae bacterium]